MDSCSYHSNDASYSPSHCSHCRLFLLLAAPPLTPLLPYALSYMDASPSACWGHRHGSGWDWSQVRRKSREEEEIRLGVDGRVYGSPSASDACSGGERR